MKIAPFSYFQSHFVQSLILRGKSPGELRTQNKLKFVLENANPTYNLKILCLNVLHESPFNDSFEFF
jgi:hypothetical protein